VKLHDLQHVVNALEQGQSARPKKRKEIVDLAKVGLSTKVTSMDDDIKRGGSTSQDVPEKIGNRPKTGIHGLKWRVMPADGSQRKPSQQQQQQPQPQPQPQRLLQHQGPESQHASVELPQRPPEHQPSGSQHASVDTPQRSPQLQAIEARHGSVETAQSDGDLSAAVSAKSLEVTKNKELPRSSKLVETAKIAELAGSCQSTSHGGSEGGSLTHEFSGSVLEEDVPALPHRPMQRRQMRSLSVDSFDLRTNPVASLNVVRDVDDRRAINCSRALQDPRTRALRDPRGTVWCKPAEPAEEKAMTNVASLKRR